MLFDWFTFIAQFINFIILVLLLKRFLFKPVLKAVDERERSIAAQIQNAENVKKEAITELNDYRRKNMELDQRRQEFLDDAIREANEERNKQLKQLNAEIETLRFQFNETIENEQKNLKEEIKRLTKDEVFTIVRKVLYDLASSSLEDQIAEVFIEKLKKLDTKEKEQLRSEIHKIKGGLIVRTTYELATAQQKILTDILSNSHFGELPVRFETAPELVSGIELIAGGYKLVWSIEDYLAAMEGNMAGLISAKT